MRIKRKTRRLVRLWVPRFRHLDALALWTYRKYANNLFETSEAYIIERICDSEIRRRRIENWRSA